MSEYLPEHIPGSRTLWLRGIVIRCFTIHISAGIALLPVDGFFLFFGWVSLIEVLVFLLYIRSNRKDGLLVAQAMSWAAASDIHFFFSAVFMAYASGILPTWGYLAMASAWIGALSCEHTVARFINPPKTMSRHFISSASDKQARSNPTVKLLINLLTYTSFAILAVGFMGVVLAYALSKDDAIKAALAVASIGLALGFSAQSRALMLAYRFRNLPWN